MRNSCERRILYSPSAGVALNVVCSRHILYYSCSSYYSLWFSFYESYYTSKCRKYLFIRQNFIEHITPNIQLLMRCSCLYRTPFPPTFQRPFTIYSLFTLEQIFDFTLHSTPIYTPSTPHLTPIYTHICCTTRASRIRPTPSWWAQPRPLGAETPKTWWHTSTSLAQVQYNTFRLPSTSDCGPC